MELPREPQGAYQVDDLVSLGRLRAGGLTPRRDFFSVSVDIPYLARLQRRSWERELNEPLRATGDIIGLVGSLVGTALYVLWVATATGGPGGNWWLLAVGVVMIALGGAAGKMFGSWYAIRVFRHRAGQFERFVQSLRPIR